VASNLLKILKQIIIPRKFRFDGKFMVFLFFLFLSTVFWFLSALSKNYSSIVTCNVRYTNFPKKKFLTGNLPNKLSVKINGFGFSILRHNLTTQFYPVIVDVENLQLRKASKTDSTKYVGLTSMIYSEIANQMSSDISIIDVNPDTLLFEFTDILDKRVPVKPDVETSFDKQFMMNGTITTKPDYIVISGPRTIISKINSVSTRKKRYVKLNEPVKELVSLISVKGIEMYQKEVEVNIPVEKYTEASLKLPIEVINRPGGVVLRIFPNQIQISFLVALSEYKKVKANQFRVVVDYNSVVNNPGNKLKVDVTNSPANIHSQKFEPSYVEYLIEK
jgi:hypothetical protein